MGIHTEGLRDDQFEVKRKSRPQVTRLAEKILDLSVRKTDITSDVVRAGNYMLSDGQAIVDGYNVEVETYIHDLATTTEVDGSSPRFALAICPRRRIQY